MLIDLHVVPKAGADLARLLSLARKNGLDGVCLCGTASAPPMAEARACPDLGGLEVFFGIEFVVERGRLLWIPADPAVLETDAWKAHGTDTAASVGAMVRDLGGALIAVHPYDRTQGPAFTDGVYQVPELTAIEIANSTASRIACDMALEAAARRRLTAVGGSDGPDSPGRSATVFLAEIRDQAGLVAALGRGDVWVVESLASQERAGPARRDEPKPGSQPGRDGRSHHRRHGGRGRGGPGPEAEAGTGTGTEE